MATAGVIGQIDRSHAALTEFGLDAVAALQGCVQAGDGFAHAVKMRRRSAEREILQQNQRQPQREERRGEDHGAQADSSATEKSESTVIPLASSAATSVQLTLVEVR